MKKNIVLLLLMVFTSGFSQQKQDKIKVFYDCQTTCYETYVKQNLSNVEFVRDRNFADVHIMIISESNAGNGEKYLLEFFGQHKYKDIHKKLSFSTSSDTTEEQVQQSIIKYLKIGLLDFWLQNGLADKLDINIKSDAVKKVEKDKWNNWIYKFGANGWFNGDSNSRNSSINGYVSVTQVKDAHKFALKLRYYTGNSSYKYGDSEIKSEKESLSASVSEVLSINEHWSYGFFGRVDRSKFQNFDKAGEVYAGLEYNIFPYTESAKKSLVFTTKLGMLYNQYFEKTIYNKMDELVFRSKFIVTGNIVKKWGSLYANINYSTYLHNLKLNSIGLGSGASLRVAKGLNFNLNAYYSINHDQINIAAGDLSLEETLLAQKELQSGYGYYFSVGFSYSFGSIYNSIVNPRFDADSGQSSTCICF